MRRLLTYIFLLTCLTTTAQTYYLPKTAVRLHLMIEKHTYKPGDFAAYAERYLRLPYVQRQEQVTHRVVSCELSTIGIRDTSKCYQLQLKKGKAKGSSVRMSDDGVLLAINDMPLEVDTKTYPTIPLRGSKGNKTPNARTLLTAETLAAGSTAKMAELTAQQITELRERRQHLISGEAEDMPQDEGQLQLMLNEIDRQCNTLMTLFTGTTQRDTTEQTITLCPEREVERQVVFRLSHRQGLVDSDDLSGIPFYMTVKNLHPADSIPVPENKKGEDIYVNVPSTVELTLQQEDQTLAVFNIPMGQFGYLELRDGDLFKKYITHLQLHPTTGAVVRMESETEKKK